MTAGDSPDAAKSVGIKQLKTRLSEYLRLVRSGEVVLVTDHDEVVRELRPARGQFGAANWLDERMNSLAERGELTRAGLWRSGWKWNARGPGLAAGCAITILDEALRRRRGRYLAESQIRSGDHRAVFRSPAPRHGRTRLELVANGDIWTAATLSCPPSRGVSLVAHFG